uniref:Endonuclease exonuclease phosphatase domain containing protein n=1 Tax=Haemonchus contortus TaxID=6289 RepID=A0A7I4Z5L3_HAECO
MRQQRRRRRRCPRQYAPGHEHRFVQAYQAEANVCDSHQHQATKRSCRIDMDLERLYREDHTFFKVIVGDFNAKIRLRRTAEELHIETHGTEWNEQGERLPEFIMSTHSIQATGTTSLPLQVTGKNPLSTTSMENATSSSNIFTIALGKQRVYK